ncbi:MAG TPA: lipopolysaccharide assembly protein LapA domain-containing protein [Bacilli bacterium]
MKIQWTLIFALIFALLTAIFAVLNVNTVPVNYIFGDADVPLVLVIISSSLLGGLIVGLFGIIRQYRLQKKIQHLEAQLQKEAKTNATVPEILAASTKNLENHPQNSEQER